jgi:WD40 repeat protein
VSSKSGSSRRPLDATTYRVELWDLTGKKLLQRIDRPVDSRTGQPGISGIIGDRDAFYLPDLPAPGLIHEIDYSIRKSPLKYAWSDGKELKRPEEAITSYQQPFGRRYAHARGTSGGSDGFDPERKSWVLWRGRNGLELQSGWNRRQALAPPSIPTGQSIMPHEGQISTNGRLFSLVFDVVELDRTRPPNPDRPSSTRTAVWDAATGRLLVECSSDTSPPTFDSSDQWVAVKNPSNATIDIYKTSSGERTRQVKLAGLPRESPSHFPPSFQVNPQGDRLAFVHQGVLYLWDATADRAVVVEDKPGHFGTVDCVAQHPASELIASGGSEGVVVLWDRRQGRYVRTLIGHASRIVALAFHPDGRRLASASSDGAVIFWDVAGRAIWTSRAAKSGIIANGLVFDLAGTALLIGSSQGQLLRLDTTLGEPAREDPTEKAGLSALAFSSTGTRVAAASVRGHVQIWDGDLSRVQCAWEAGSTVDTMAFAGDDFLLTGRRQMVELRETATGRLLFTHEPPQAPIRMLKVDARTGDLYVADASKALHIMNLGDLQGVLSEMTLEIPNFPFTGGSENNKADPWNPPNHAAPSRPAPSTRPRVWSQIKMMKGIE